MDGMCLVHAYDPKSNKWTSLPQKNIVLFGLCMFQNKLVLVGGSVCDGVSNKIYTLIETDNLKWENRIPPMNIGRASLSVFSTETALITCGGAAWNVGGGFTPTNLVEVYSSKTRQWTCMRHLPHPCACISATVMNNICFMLGEIDPSDKCSILCADLSDISSISTAKASTHALAASTTPSLTATASSTSSSSSSYPNSLPCCSSSFSSSSQTSYTSFSISSNSSRCKSPSPTTGILAPAHTVTPTMELPLVPSFSPPKASASSKWFTLPPPPTDRATILGVKDYILALGGGDKGISQSVVHVYNKESRCWLKMEGGELPKPVKGCGCILLKTGEILMVGGDDNRRNSISDVYIGTLS